MLDALTFPPDAGICPWPNPLPAHQQHHVVYGSASLRLMLASAERKLIAERRWIDRNPVLTVTRGGAHREAQRQVRVLTDQLALRVQLEAAIREGRS